MPGKEAALLRAEMATADRLAGALEALLHGRWPQGGPTMCEAEAALAEWRARRLAQRDDPKHEVRLVHRAAHLIRAFLVRQLRSAGYGIRDVGMIMRLSPENVRRHAARAARYERTGK